MIPEKLDLPCLIKADTLKVTSPSSVVFLCGGAFDGALSQPQVLRDAFFRMKGPASVVYDIILAEDADPLTADAGYFDLLSFESDIAQVVGLILLFVESAGSLAELGAFAALDTIAPSLLAVLASAHYDSRSFVRNGPVAYLERRHGDEAIHVLDCDEIGLSADGHIRDLNMLAFAESMLTVVSARLRSKPKWSKYNQGNAGHVILLIVGLCHEYGALTQEEIRSFCESLGVREIRFHNFVYCASLLGWIKKIRKGNHVFYASSSPQSAVEFSFRGQSGYKQRIRFRSDLRAHYRDTKDFSRLNAIAFATGSLS